MTHTVIYDKKKFENQNKTETKNKGTEIEKYFTT